MKRVGDRIKQKGKRIGKIVEIQKSMSGKNIYVEEASPNVSDGFFEEELEILCVYLTGGGDCFLSELNGYKRIECIKMKGKECVDEREE